MLYIYILIVLYIHWFYLFIFYFYKLVIYILRGNKYPKNPTIFQKFKDELRPWKEWSLRFCFAFLFFKTIYGKCKRWICDGVPLACDGSSFCTGGWVMCLCACGLSPSPQGNLRFWMRPKLYHLRRTWSTNHKKQNSTSSQHLL